MLGGIFKPFNFTLYIQIWEKRIKATYVENGRIFEQQPLVAVQRDKKNNLQIIEIGNKVTACSDGDVEVINPFSHPRVLLADFQVAEKLLINIIKRLVDSKFLTPSPFIVVHPMEKTEGGLTQIEERAFKELAAGAGARKVIVYIGNELDIANFDFATLKVK